MMTWSYQEIAVTNPKRAYILYMLLQGRYTVGMWCTMVRVY